ncbi:unnamed protein product [Onchocerca flexuosa]|uniref:Transposase n=1 Tax=Onchocerca flexuosa TaxID=387005 RepID=A0A183HCG9_9BILA|nr:unnamed protein product [Onchocerca flexuosa]
MRDGRLGKFSLRERAEVFEKAAICMCMCMYIYACLMMMVGEGETGRDDRSIGRLIGRVNNRCLGLFSPSLTHS